MYDSYGDGWNGNTLIIGDGVYTVESGFEGFANVGCETDDPDPECSEAQITGDGSGGWPEEVEWTISNCDGEILASGGATFDDCVDLPDTFTIEMYDSYGDGWNGNTLVIGDEVYTLETGSEGSANVGCETEEEIVEEVDGCPDGFVEDCNGNCAPEIWIGEGAPYCDDGTYSFNLESTLESGVNVWCQGCEEEGYVAIDFNCEAFDWDGGDCEEEEEEEIVEEEICEGITVTCDGGSWQSEVSWTISDCDGTVLAEGGSPFEGCLDLPDVFTIEMFDSYGDGWNGNTLIIGDEVYTIESGSENFANVGCDIEEEEEVIDGCPDGYIADCNGNCAPSTWGPKSSAAWPCNCMAPTAMRSTRGRSFLSNSRWRNCS